MGTTYSGYQVAASGGVLGARGLAGSSGPGGSAGGIGRGGRGGSGGRGVGPGNGIRAASGNNGAIGTAGGGGAPGQLGAAGGAGQAGSAGGSGIYIGSGAVTTAMPANHVGVLIQPPASVTAGATFSLEVDAEDANSNTDPTYNGPLTVSIGTNPGGSSLLGTVTLNAVNGVALFTGLALSQPASGYTLSVGSTGLTSGVTKPFTVTPARTPVCRRR